MKQRHISSRADVPHGHIRIEKHWPRHELLAALFNHSPKPPLLNAPLLKMGDDEARSLVGGGLPLGWVRGRNLMLTFEAHSFNPTGYIARNGRDALAGALDEMREKHPEPTKPGRPSVVAPAIRAMFKKHLP